MGPTDLTETNDANYDSIFVLQEQTPLSDKKQTIDKSKPEWVLFQKACECFTGIFLFESGTFGVIM